MKIKPVRRIAAPRYPDCYSVDAGKLLRSNVPMRWRSAPAAGLVLSAVVMLGLAGCDRADGGAGRAGGVAVTDGVMIPNDTPEITIEPTPVDDEYITAGLPMQAPMQPPVFEHGEGIGVYGCVSVVAPVFLSEDDAYAIIRDEFEKLNMTVSRDGGTIDNVRLPVTTTNYDDNRAFVGKTRGGELSFDFRVEDRDIVMEYVSSVDVQAWADDEEGVWTSVTSEDYLGTAKLLNESLNASNRETGIPAMHGVFYDPAERSEYYEGIDYEQAAAKAQERAAELLREQVRDFIDWLVSAGII